MTRSGESEQRLTEALRARATGGPGRPPARGGSATTDRATRLALLVALGVGVLVGVLLALVSLLAPGVLPTLG